LTRYPACTVQGWQYTRHSSVWELPSRDVRVTSGSCARLTLPLYGPGEAPGTHTWPRASCCDRTSPLKSPGLWHQAAWEGFRAGARPRATSHQRYGPGPVSTFALCERAAASVQRACNSVRAATVQQRACSSERAAASEGRGVSSEANQHGEGWPPPAGVLRCPAKADRHGKAWPPLAGVTHQRWRGCRRLRGGERGRQ
jgi:hypothetical protein